MERRTHGAQGTFTRQARLAGMKVKQRRNKLRKVLADKYEVGIKELYASRIAETIRKHNIPLSDVPQELFTKGRPKEQAAPNNGNGSINIDAVHKQEPEDRGTSFPLAVIPQRIPSEPRKMGRPVGSVKRDVIGGPREMLAMRLLDLLERLL